MRAIAPDLGATDFKTRKCANSALCQRKKDCATSGGDRSRAQSQKYFRKFCSGTMNALRVGTKSAIERKNQRGSPRRRLILPSSGDGVVPGGGIEPPTRGFSIRCSTN
jgi:hypothetical protein